MGVGIVEAGEGAGGEGERTRVGGEGVTTRAACAARVAALPPPPPPPRAGRRRALVRVSLGGLGWVRVGQA